MSGFEPPVQKITTLGGPPPIPGQNRGQYPHPSAVQINRNNIAEVRARAEELMRSADGFLQASGGYDQLNVPRGARHRSLAPTKGEPTSLHQAVDWERKNRNSKGLFGMKSQNELVDGAFDSQLRRSHNRHNMVACAMIGYVLATQDRAASVGTDQALLVGQMAELHQLSEIIRDHDLNYTAREMGQFLDISGQDLSHAAQKSLWQHEINGGPLRRGLGLDEDPRRAWETVDRTARSERFLQSARQEPELDWAIMDGNQIKRRTQERAEKGHQPMAGTAGARTKAGTMLSEAPHLLGEAFVRRMMGPFAGKRQDSTVPKGYVDAIRKSRDYSAASDHRAARQSRTSVQSMAEQTIAREGQRRNRDGLARRAVVSMESQENMWHSPGYEGSDGLG